jgi:hypothetical protein
MRAPAYLTDLFAEHEALVTKDPRHLTADEARSVAYYRTEVLLLQAGEAGDETRDRVTAWIRTAQSVDRYVAVHGRVPRRSSRRSGQSESADSLRLAVWLEDQRRSAARDRQCTYQLKRIAAYPTFDPRSRDERWQAALTDYRTFLQEHGRAPSARSTNPTERSLGLWATRQRRLYRNDALAVERATGLAETLPIWTWGVRGLH